MSEIQKLSLNNKLFCCSVVLVTNPRTTHNGSIRASGWLSFHLCLLRYSGFILKLGWSLNHNKLFSLDWKMLWDRPDTSTASFWTNKLQMLPLQNTPSTMISVKDISDYNYEGEWGSRKAQHQDYDSLISISHQRWSIDFLPNSITVKRDVLRLSTSHAHPGAWWESMKEGGKRQKAITEVL